MDTGKNPTGASKKDIAEDMKAKANQASQDVKSKAKEQFEAQDSQAVATMDKVAEATGAAAQELARKGEPTLSHYMTEIAQGIGTLSDNLRHKNTDELIHDASRLARQNTGLFLLGSVALGFGLSRIAKAARSSSDGESEWESKYGQQDSSPYAGREQAAGMSASGGSNPSHASTSYLPEEGSSDQRPAGSPNPNMNPGQAQRGSKSAGSSGSANRPSS
ncbi:MAG: hypothetical protein WDZ30_12765 [Cellvibrionaceae bacterium]